MVPIVDKNDVVIGQKKREEIDLENDIIRSSSVWVTNKKGEVLLAQRKLTKRTDPGKWAEAVGGTVDNEDSYEETAYREAEEELGIRGVDLALGPKQFVAGPPANYFVQWYVVELDWPIEKFIPQESEVEQIAWWNIEDLRRDMEENPSNYIDALPSVVDLFKKSI